MHEVVIENKALRARYHPNAHDGGIIDFELKRHGGYDVVGEHPEGMQRLDGGAGRFQPDEACIVRRTDQRATVRIAWRHAKRRGPNISEVTIYRDKPILKIDYIRANPIVFDQGQTRYTEKGAYAMYGMKAWQKLKGWSMPYPDHESLRNPYYNRLKGGVRDIKDTDPKDGGPLSYKGYFIAGCCDTTNGFGYGRVLRVADIAKLRLIGDDPAGLELRNPIKLHQLPLRRKRRQKTDPLTGKKARR
jgi:hypothetical protein